MNPLILRFTAFGPVRRACAGMAGGFLVYLGLMWCLRVVHVLTPLDNLGLVVLDLETAMGWGVFAGVVLAATGRRLVQFGVLFGLTAVLCGLALALNRSAFGDPGFFVGMARIMLICTLVLGPATTVLGGRLDEAWSRHAAA